jgi:hypothetical protein
VGFSPSFSSASAPSSMARPRWANLGGLPSGLRQGDAQAAQPGQVSPDPEI